MYKNLKDYIDKLESAGELVRISALVSTHEEIAEITDREVKREGGGRALLFENTGTEFPVLTNMMGSLRRMAMALGVERLEEIGERINSLLGDALSPKATLMDKLRMLPLLADVAKWFPKNVSGRGECQQVVWQGDEASLERLPLLHSWEYDGGAFVTLPMVNTVDADTGIRNVGMYRMQRFDAHTTGMHWHVHKTGARHYETYKRRGERMPVVVTLGGDPVYTYCATAPMPDNMDEYLLAGFLRRKPVKLVKALTCDIRIPSDCDFVIEGYVDTMEQKAVEGDFGDHTGFYSLKDLYPRFHITAITHRKGAIYPATVVGVPPQEDAYISEATEKIFLAPIRLAIQPEIEDLWMPVEGTSHNIAVLSISKRYEAQAAKVAQAMWGAGQMMFNKYMLILPAGESIRSYDYLGRMLRRADVRRNIVRTEGVLDVLDHATATCGVGGKLAFDLTSVDVQQGVEPVRLPEQYMACGGIGSCDDSLAQEYAILILFAQEGNYADVDVAMYLQQNNIAGIKYVALFDAAASAAMSHSDLLWLAAANTDPRRDVNSLECDALLFDARSKKPGVGAAPKRFPNVVTSSAEIIAKVDARWSEYGLGEFVSSPSLRYRTLRLSNKAEW